MYRRRHIRFGSAGGCALLLIGIWILCSRCTNPVESQIPEPGTNNLSETVRDQIMEALKKAQDDPTGDNLGLLGMVYHASALYEEAATCYGLALQRDKPAWLWNYYLGYLKLEMGETEAVIGNFQQVIHKNPDMGLAWYYLGEQYANQGNTDRATEAFGKIIDPGEDSRASKSRSDEHPPLPVHTSTRTDHFPLRTYARYQLGRIQYETGRTELAEKTLREITLANRTFGPAYRLLGTVYGSLGDSILSNQFRIRANDLINYDSPVDTLVDQLVLLSRSALFLLKKVDEAERGIYDRWTLRVAEHAMQYLPDNRYLITKAMRIYLWMDLEQKAIGLVDRHMEIYREDAAEMIRMGIYFFQKRLYPQAVRYLARGLELEPEQKDLPIQLAICYRALGQQDKAIEMLDEFYMHNNSDETVVGKIAELLYFNFRAVEKARAYLSRLEQLAPSNPKLLKIRGGMAAASGNPREAVRWYEAAFRNDPEDMLTIRYLANLLYDLQMWGPSIDLFREALDYHPNEPYLLERLGTLLVMSPDTALLDIREGILYLERAFIHKASRPGTLMEAGRSMAIGCAKLGDRRNALVTMEQTMEIARRENAGPAYLEELEELYETFRSMQE